MSRKALLTIGLALLTACGSIVSSSEIHGDVKTSDGVPLAGASVVSDIPGIGAKTDSSGHFLLSYNEIAPTRVTVSYLGFRPQLIEISRIEPGLTIHCHLEPVVVAGPTVTVFDTRAAATGPSANSMSSSDIARDYTVGDVPHLLETTPNVDAFSDAGAGLGYSYLSIRGFGNERIRLYINGVPLNDPEDQFLYFVDLPDFAGSVSAIEAQRGAGGVSTGEESFGGRVNLITYAADQPRRFSFSSGLGGFNNDGNLIGQFSKSSAQFSSGLIDGRWHFSGRYSRESSGGYRENSWYNGWGYFLSATRLDRHATTTFTTFGGPTRLHLSYNGAPRDVLSANWRANSLTYRNETDNFNQPQYHLTSSYQLSDRVMLYNTLYYIRGVGYYEQRKEGVTVSDYNLDPADFTDPSIALTRQQWVRKNQVGLNSRVEIDHARGRHTLGATAYWFDSEHWGQVESVTDAPEDFVPGLRYYQYAGRKINVSSFVTEQFDLTAKLKATATAQVIHHRAKVNQDDLGAYTRLNSYERQWTFFSPRLTLAYAPRSEHALTGIAAVVSRVPRDADVYDANDPYDKPNVNLKSERLTDVELGYQYQNQKLAFGANLFYMGFRNEVIFYSYEDDGTRRSDNAPRSYRSGIELQASHTPFARLHVSGNLSLNRNRFSEYHGAYVVYGPTTETVEQDFKGNTTPGYPGRLGNFIVDYNSPRLRLTYRLRAIGSQFVEPENLDTLRIASYSVSSLSATAQILRSSTFGIVKLSATVENLFDRRYEQSGYGGVYGERASAQDPIVLYPWGEYYPSAGRSIYAQFSIDFD